MRTGLLGGSFNPVHNAHLRIADCARRACALDRVVFIPAADPPHKTLEGDVSFEQRSAMVSLAIASRKDFTLSSIEAERAGKSYSIDTIRSFRQRFPEDELFFIIGGDSYLEIGTWHRYEEIFSECSLIIVERPGKNIQDLLEALPAEVRAVCRRDCDEEALIHRSGNRVYGITGEPLALSSTEIRQRAAAGEDIGTLVPASVADYILQQRIYHP